MPLPPALPQASVVVMDTNWEPHLRGMAQYAAAHTCRRALLACHFGEAPPPCHAMCDCCRAADAAAEAAVDAAGGKAGAAAAAAAAAAGAAGAGAAGAAAAAGGEATVPLKDVNEAAKGVVQTLEVCGMPAGDANCCVACRPAAAAVQTLPCMLCLASGTSSMRRAPLVPTGLAWQREACHPDSAGRQVAWQQGGRAGGGQVDGLGETGCCRLRAVRGSVALCTLRRFGVPAKPTLSTSLHVPPHYINRTPAWHVPPRRCRATSARRWCSS